MTETQAEEAILQHWAPLWAAAFPTVVVAYGDEEPAAVDEFVRVTRVPTTRRNQAIGGGRIANGGFITVQVFTRPGTGTQRACQLVDGVYSIFENATIASPVADDEPVCVYPDDPLPPENLGAWSMRVVRLRYRYDLI